MVVERSETEGGEIPCSIIPTASPRKRRKKGEPWDLGSRAKLLRT